MPAKSLKYEYLLLEKRIEISDIFDMFGFKESFVAQKTGLSHVTVCRHLNGWPISKSAARKYAVMINQILKSEPVDPDSLVLGKCHLCGNQNGTVVHAINNDKSVRKWNICFDCYDKIGRFGEIPEK